MISAFGRKETPSSVDRRRIVANRPQLIVLVRFLCAAGTASGFAHYIATRGPLHICHDSAAGLASSPFNR
jgi:hypothetical protein